MDDDLDWPNEPLFDFSGRLSLQTLASTKLALNLWRYKICNQTDKPDEILTINAWPFYVRKTILTGSERYSQTVWKHLGGFCLNKNIKFSCRDIVVVSTRIGDLIDERIVSIGKELQIWMEKLIDWYPYHSRGKFVEMFSVFFDNVVLEKDGTICIRSTVMGILKSTRVQIASATKYRMACEFCLENCVRELWPLESNNLNEVWRSPSPLMLYWDDIMMSESDEESAQYQRIPSITNNNLIALEYFWNKLSTDEQTAWTVDALRNADFRIVKRFLPKLNKIQVRRVCAVPGGRIFGEMLKEDEYFQYAVMLWTCMKDSVSKRIFHAVLRHSWLFVFNPSESNIVRISQRKALLRDVWTSASDQLKAFVLKRDNFVELFSELDDKARSFDNYDCELLFELMTNVDYELRRTVWLKNWRKLVARLKPSKLEELMKLCLANEEVEQFKEQKMANFEALESYFSSCIENKLIAELSQYLTYYMKDPRRLENLSKEIILSNLHPILLCDDENELAKYHSLIHSTFRNSQSADKFTEELILAPEFLAVIHSKLDDVLFEEVIRMSSRFPTSERNMNEMKRGLVDYCKNNFARGQIAGFVGQKLENFLNWCCLNETLISEFKQPLIPDNILEMIVYKVMPERCIVYKVMPERCTAPHMSPTLLDFDNFLEWYFGSSEKAKIYKSSESVDKYLKWAFGNNTK